MPRVLSRQADVRREAEDIYASLLNREAELPQLKMSVDSLGELLRLVRGLTTQQDALRAGKQSTTKELDAALKKLSKLVTFLQVGLRHHYGSDSETLLEFRIQPFRGRTRGARTPETPETPEPPAPPETGPQVTPDDKSES